MLLTVEDIMGAAEIGALLSVSRQRVQQLVAREDFPRPYKELAMGKVWLTRTVYDWIRSHRPDVQLPGDPPVETD